MILEELLHLYADNWGLAKGSPLDKAGKMMTASAVFMHTQSGKRINVDRLVELKAMLHEKEGIFSPFRGNMENPTISAMAIHNHPEQLLVRMHEAFDLLKAHKAPASTARSMVALTLASVQTESMEPIVEKTMAIYKDITHKHPFLHGEEDLLFSSLMALSSKNTEALCADAEVCYRLLKDEKLNWNAAQSLACLVAIHSGTNESKCGRIIDLWTSFRENGIKYARGFETTILSASLAYNVPVHRVCEDLMHADEYMKDLKGMSGLYLAHSQRLMFALGLVLQSYSEEGQTDTVSLSTIAADSALILMLIAQETALMCCIAASTASAATH